MNICFGDIEGFPRIMYETRKVPMLIQGEDVAREQLPNATGTENLASGSRQAELDELAAEKEKDGQLMLATVGILGAVVVTYFALQ